MKVPRFLSLVSLASVFAAVAEGMFVAPTLAPIDRLLANTTAYVKENPKDAHGYYTLARIHYLAFANKSGLAGAFERETPPKIPEDWLLGDFVRNAQYKHAEGLTLKEFGYSSMEAIPYGERERFFKVVEQKKKELEEQGWVPEKIGEKELFEHAGAALRNFQKAIELDSDNALYHHGLASLLEQYVQLLAEIKAEHVPEEFRRFILSKVKDIYHTAYNLSIKKDLKNRYRPLSGLRSLISHEAGNAYVRLSETLGCKSKEETKKVGKVKEGLKKLDRLPKSRIVTPIIFSLEQHRTLRDLLTPDKSVRFDLDGDGLIEKWPWVKPATGILVWDPKGDAVITSGRQMFGSVSWWLFFEDGYHALDALDDNRDGVLSGGELGGIRVWFDRNCDGISRQEEVVPLRNLRIVAIGTKASGKKNGVPMCLSGLRRSDGTTIATYDWLCSPAVGRNSD